MALVLRSTEAAVAAVAERANNRFVKDIILTNLPLPVLKIRTYVWLSLLARSLGTDGYGAWSLSLITLGILTTIGSMTLGSAMMRFLSGNRSLVETRQAFSSVLSAISISSVTIAIVVFCLSGYLSDAIFHRRSYRPVVVLLAIAVVSDLFYEQMRGFLRARRLNRSWAVFTIARIVPEMLAVVGCAYYFGQIFAAFCAYSVFSILSAVGGLWYLMKGQGFQFVRPSWPLLRRYCAYGSALVPGALAALLSFSADKYLVGHYLDLSQVGIYSVCFTISALGFFLVGPINDVLMPEMSALHETRDWATFDRRFAGIQKFIFGFGVGATAILAAFPSALLKLFAGRAFVSGGPVLAILGLQGVFMSFVMLYVVILNVKLRVWTSSLVWAVMGVIIVIADVILVPKIGILGAAFSQLGSAILGAAVLAGLNWPLFRRTFRLTWAIRGAVAAIGVWALTAIPFLGKYADLHPITAILFGAGVYVLGLLATQFTDIDEVTGVAKAVLA